MINESKEETAPKEEVSFVKEDAKPVKKKVEKPMVKENPKFESDDAEDDFKA